MSRAFSDNSRSRIALRRKTQDTLPKTVLSKGLAQVSDQPTFESGEEPRETAILVPVQAAERPVATSRKRSQCPNCKRSYTPPTLWAEGLLGLAASTIPLRWPRHSRGSAQNPTPGMDGHRQTIWAWTNWYPFIFHLLDHHGFCCAQVSNLLPREETPEGRRAWQDSGAFANSDQYGDQREVISY